jgi:hypothetical protein
MVMKKTPKAIQVIIGTDQTVVYSSSRLPKPQLVGYLYKFQTDVETVKLWNRFSVEEQNALVQRAVEKKKDVRLIIQETAQADE